jgi:CHAT domain-containing protein
LIVSDGWVIGFVEASQKLYQKLLPKAARQLLVGASILYIVPTGVLYGVPFEALLNTPTQAENMPRYLIQDYAIAYLSSASLLKTFMA